LEYCKVIKGLAGFRRGACWTHRWTFFPGYPAENLAGLFPGRCSLMPEAIWGADIRELSAVAVTFEPVGERATTRESSPLKN
jgi:hypothetical protein